MAGLTKAQRAAKEAAKEPTATEVVEEVEAAAKNGDLEDMHANLVKPAAKARK